MHIADGFWEQACAVVRAAPRDGKSRHVVRRKFMDGLLEAAMAVITLTGSFENQHFLREFYTMPQYNSFRLKAVKGI